MSSSEARGQACPEKGASKTLRAVWGRAETIKGCWQHRWPLNCMISWRSRPSLLLSSTSHSAGFQLAFMESPAPCPAIHSSRQAAPATTVQ